MPQLTNEMQLMIMNKVKKGELSIDDALSQARKGREKLQKQKTKEEVFEQEPVSLYNFSVHKHGRYRWQKRVIQFDFKTQKLCSIEKGIVKRQLSFSMVKSCDDGAGSRFSISFRDHHDYELEANSMEDKHKMMELVNKIIYGNIYTTHKVGSSESAQASTAPQSVREGELLLHRGGLASFRWVKHQVQLHPGQLVMSPVKRRTTADGEVLPAVPTVIHLSDGTTTVEKTQSPETFSLTTSKNQYHFRVPPPETTNLSTSVKSERDAWVQAIHKLCVDWKRKSCADLPGGATNNLRHTSIEEEEDNSETETGANRDINAGLNSDALSTEVFKPVAKPRKNSAKASSPRQTQPPSSPEPVNKHQSFTPISPKTLQSPIGVLPQSPFSPHSSVFLPPEFPTASKMLSRRSGWNNSQGGFPFQDASPPPTPPPRLSRLHLLLPPHLTLLHPLLPLFRPTSTCCSLLYPSSSCSTSSSSANEGEDADQTECNQGFPLGRGGSRKDIFLKSFPVGPGELKDKLYIINHENGGLSDEHITSLRRYVPTPDDVEMYKSHKGPVSELHVVDQYMLEMCNIPT
ncbi:hypothetical protein WMY93_017719 [Mugilogobius chulae]|uniref:PH domain-containing protein n=1 Tax=Mugilogobius chulae TaxID=88201 RepID=A0AAW0NZD7_9GOBI